MSQNDMIIADAAGAAFLADLNSAIGALVSNSSGATEPATMYAYQLWADTTSGWLKQRNAANSAWIKRFPLGTAARTDIASAATLDLDGNSATSDYLRVTGTTTTTAITLADGQRRFLIANAAWPITHGASLICPGSTSYTCAAGDIVLAIGEPAGVVRLMIWKGDGTPVVSSGTSAKVNNFRLTLTSGTPVTTSDVTAAGTIYACPYNGNQISLYISGAWVTRSSAQFSLALSALTSGKPYDVFCYDNAGTPTLEFLVWTNDTTRATALAYQDGVLVKSGDSTRRYLGTFYTTSTTTTEDSAVKRFLWNYYNRCARSMKRLEATASWTYTTAAYRQANNSAANQLDFVVGVAEDEVNATLNAGWANSSGSVVANGGIGVDSTSAIASTAAMSQAAANAVSLVAATYSGIPGVGRHYLAWLEYSVAAGTTTWYGASGTLQSGIAGRVMG